VSQLGGILSSRINPSIVPSICPNAALPKREPIWWEWEGKGNGEWRVRFPRVLITRGLDHPRDVHEMVLVSETHVDSFRHEVLCDRWQSLVFGTIYMGNLL